MILRQAARPGLVTLVALLSACREPAHSEIPPLTTARPSEVHASAGDTSSAAAVGSTPPPAATSVVTAAFLEGTSTITPPTCSSVYLYAVKGALTVEHAVKGAQGEERVDLAPGDMIMLDYPTPLSIKAAGLGVEVMAEFDCQVLSRPPESRTVVRSKDQKPLYWAKKAMMAAALADAKMSPRAYVGRLEGTAPVAEHDHPTSNETLIAIEGAGTFMLDGKPHRLSPKQIVQVPKGTKHSFTPDAGSKLIAIQVYDPPGPELRFAHLAAAEADAGAR